MLERASQRIIYRLEKFLPIERLLEETAVLWPIERRAIEQVGATGDQDHWQPGPTRLNRSGEFKTVHDGHADVRNHAVNLPQAVTLQQGRCGRKQAHIIVRRFQQTFD